MDITYPKYEHVLLYMYSVTRLFKSLVLHFNLFALMC